MTEPTGNRSGVAWRHQATVFGYLRGTEQPSDASLVPPVGRPPAPTEGQFPPRSEDILYSKLTELDNTNNNFNWRIFGLVSTGVAFVIGTILLLNTKREA